MKLYSYWRSSSAWRVRIVLHWKSVPFACVPVNLAPDVHAQTAPDFAAVNPLHQVPTLEWMENDAVTRVSQSVAIAEFLEERYPLPPLLPAHPTERAWVRRAVEIVNSGTQPLQNIGVLNDVRALGGDGAVKSWAQKAITRGLAALEYHASVHGGLFSVGNVPTLADVFLVPQLYNARRFEVDLSGFSHLLAIESRAAALPAFGLAHPDQQPDAPAPAAGT